MSFNGEVFEIKTVTAFPQPYKKESSPYNSSDFSEKTMEMCKDCTLPKTHKVFKIIVLGDVSVGKTCILNRFCRKTFNSNYKATIGVDFEVEIFNVLGVSFTLQIWDTAGQERFKSIAQSYYRGAHAIVIVFDMSSLLSLSHCEMWLKEAFNAGNTNESLIFLVGNKSDLLSTSAYKNMEKIGIETAQKLRAEYWSVSAKAGGNIKEIFLRIGALIFDSSMEKEKDMISNANGVDIGTILVSFKKNSANKKEASKCNCSK